MKIDRKLSLIIPVDHGSNTYYVHATPISREVFEQNFILLSRALTMLYASGGPTPMNARLAMLYLKKTASEMAGANESAESLTLPLIQEMGRLSSVLVPNHQGGGYEVIPWHQAVERKLFDEEDAREVENVLVFFMLSWHMHKKTELDDLSRLLIGLGGQEFTSLTPTAYGASLTTSTVAAPTPKKATASSIPS